MPVVRVASSAVGNARNVSSLEGIDATQGAYGGRDPVACCYFLLDGHGRGELRIIDDASCSLRLLDLYTQSCKKLVMFLKLAKLTHGQCSHPWLQRHPAMPPSTLNRFLYNWADVISSAAHVSESEGIHVNRRRSNRQYCDKSFRGGGITEI